MRHYIGLFVLGCCLQAPPAHGASYVLAVTYFDAHSVRPELEPLGRGVADMLMTDLARSADVRIVERNRLNEVLAELELHRTQYFDEATAQRLGEGLGATHVVVGSMTAGMDGMRIDARVVSVSTGEVELSAQATGGEEAFFELERVLASRLLDGLGVAVDEIPVRDGLSLDDAIARARTIDERDGEYLDRLRAMREYRSRRLVRDALSITAGNAQSVSTVVTWGIKDGGGAPYSAYSFAQRVGDTSVLEKMKKRRIGATITGFSFLGLGVGMFVGGLVVFDKLEKDILYGDEAMIGGVVVFCTGITFMCMVPIPQLGESARQAYLANYYTPERADELIREYNEALGEELGLSREDVLQLDLHGSRQRPPVRPWARPILSFGAVGVVGVF